MLALKQPVGYNRPANSYEFLTPPFMLLRPNWTSANTLTVTQFVHEWAHSLENKGWDIADAGRGRPSYPADIDAVNALWEYSKTLLHTREALYGTAVLGEKKHRIKVAEGFFNEYDIEFPTYELMFTPGGQFGIAAVANLVAALNGGYIITPQPWYVNHEVIASIYSKLHPINFFTERKITPENLQAAIDTCPKIGAFLFCNPGNPLGNVMRKSDWEKLGPILERYDVPIILDEAFAEIVFDFDFKISLINALPHLADRIIIMRSGTKALGLPGERLAVQRVPVKYMPVIEQFQSRLIGNCPLSGQAAMAAAFGNISTEKKLAISNYYKDNAEFLIRQTIQPVGSPPEGGFYYIADFSFMLGAKMPKEARAAYSESKTTIDNDIDICMALMFGFGQHEKSGLGTVPASCFGIDSKLGYVRISFSAQNSELAEIANHMNQVRKFST